MRPPWTPLTQAFAARLPAPPMLRCAALRVARSGAAAGAGAARFALPCIVVALLVGCAPKPDPVLDWNAEARLTGPEIRVLPVLGLHAEPELNLDEALAGAVVPWHREATRRERTDQLGEIPYEVSLALPGEVQVALGDAWAGRFTVGRYPVGAKDRVEAALRGRAPMDEALSEVARGDHTVLVTWVERLRGDPLTARALPGEIVETECGPVVIELDDEPYHVRARVGMALVAPDGEVILRYADDFQALLSSHDGPDRAGRDIARALAGEVAKVWPTDPAFAPRDSVLALDVGDDAPRRQAVVPFASSYR